MLIACTKCNIEIIVIIDSVQKKSHGKIVVCWASASLTWYVELLLQLFQNNFCQNQLHQNNCEKSWVYNFDMIMHSRLWIAMLLYLCGQMAHCFTRTLEFINHIDQQEQRCTSLQWKVVSNFERCENNPNIYCIMPFENFSYQSFLPKITDGSPI